MQTFVSVSLIFSTTLKENTAIQRIYLNFLFDDIYILLILISSYLVLHLKILYTPLRQPANIL